MGREIESRIARLLPLWSDIGISRDCGRHTFNAPA